MPTYEYECQSCQRVFEVKQRITEAALATCDQCGGQVRRLIGPAAFILKGGGWYVTDYPSEARKKALKSESPSSSSPSEGKSSTGDGKSSPGGGGEPASSSSSGTAPASGSTRPADSAKSSPGSSTSPGPSKSSGSS